VADLAAGDKPPAIRLSNPAGQVIEPLAARGQKATVLFFLTTECPVGNSYAPEIARIVRDYKERGVLCHAVYAHETSAEITAHLRDFKLNLSALLDPQLKLAKLTGATVTPEACILGPGGEILYRGRIDDRAVKLGTVRLEPQVRDLRLALDAVLVGKPVAEKFTPAVGCYISPPDQSE
jgi:peroxiredoxin